MYVNDETDAKKNVLVHMKHSLLILFLILKGNSINTIMSERIKVRRKMMDEYGEALPLYL